MFLVHTQVVFLTLHCGVGCFLYIHKLFFTLWSKMFLVHTQVVFLTLHCGVRCFLYTHKLFFLLHIVE